MKKINFRPTKLNFVFAITIGAGFSIAFFLFTVGCREAFRILFHDTSYDSIIALSDLEILFYNFLIAFVCCLLGGSKCIEILLQYQNAPKINPHLRNSISNNQTSLLWFSIYWLSKIFLPLMFLMPFINLGLGTSLINYWYFFLIGLAVLFFSQWNRLSIAFEKGKVIMSYFGLVYLLLSLGMSTSSILIFSDANRYIRNHSICYNYDITTPKSNIGKKIDQRNYVPINLYLGKRKNLNKDTVCLVTETPNFVLSEKDLGLFASDFYSCNHCKPRTVKLVIYKNVKLEVVNKVFKILASRNQRSVFLSTNRENWGIYLGLPPPCIQDSLKDYSWLWQDCEAVVAATFKAQFATIDLNNNKIAFNNRIIKNSKLLDEVINHYNKYDSLAGFLFKYDDSSTYEFFIKVVDAINYANSSKKNAYANQIHHQSFSYETTYSENEELFFKLASKYPINLIFINKSEYDILKNGEI